MNENNLFEFKKKKTIEIVYYTDFDRYHPNSVCYAISGVQTRKLIIYIVGYPTIPLKSFQPTITHISNHLSHEPIKPHCILQRC